MKKLLEPAVLRVVLLPAIGAIGAIVAMMWPLGHKAFCDGLAGVLV